MGNIFTGSDPYIMELPLPVWPGNQQGNYMTVSMGNPGDPYFNKWSAPNAQTGQMVRYLKNMQGATAVAPATGGLFAAMGPFLTLASQLIGSGGGLGGLFGTGVNEVGNTGSLIGQLIGSGGFLGA